MNRRFPTPAAQSLFLEARARPLDTRDAWLRATCGDDAALYEAVASLLEGERDADSFEPPSPTLVASWFEPTTLGEMSGRRVGSCTLVRPIAEGGMGRVYEAIQEPPGRRVAVKLLRQALPDEGSRARFEEEASLLAAIDHPGVCRVFEAGTFVSDGGEKLPYCVMELVEGARSFTEHVAAANLAIAERVRLFLDVCTAVAASHAKGVLHRDLKPANVLVGGDGRPKVIDFGIARSMAERGAAHPRLTRSGMVLGTPAYMSPEQLLGRPEDVDVRSDVHALGVILYEALTGRLPRDLGDGSLAAAVDALRGGTPVPPEQHDPRIERDLSAVVRKSIDSDPARRYRSVAEFADDLSAWLHHRPVGARVPGPTHALALWIRRHRAVAALVAALVLAIGAGSTWAIVSAGRERSARESADRERMRVEAFLRQSDDFVPWILTEHQRDVAGLPRSEPVVRSLIGAVRRHLAALSYEHVRDPALLLTAARSYAKLASIEGGFGVDAHGMRDDARIDATRAIDLARRSRSLLPSANAYEAEMEGELFLAQMAQFDGDLPAASGRSDAVAALLSEMEGRRDFAPSEEIASFRLRTAILRGDLKLAAGDATGALAIHADFFRWLEAAGNPSVLTSSLLEIRIKSGQAHAMLGAKEGVDRALDLVEKEATRWESVDLAAGYPATDARRERYRGLVRVGDGAYRSGRLSPLPAFTRALAALAAWREATPGDRAIDREEATLLRRMGAIGLDERGYDEALPRLERAVEISRRLVGEDPTDPATALVLLESTLVRAEVEQRLGRADASTRSLSEAEELGTRIRAAFPHDKEAWLAHGRVVLTRAATDTVTAESEKDPTKARVLLEGAIRLTAEGARTYRESVAHGVERATAEWIAAACDGEVARLRGLIDALGPK